jgi:hypothetical protein
MKSHKSRYEKRVIAFVFNEYKHSLKSSVAQWAQYHLQISLPYPLLAVTMKHTIHLCSTINSAKEVSTCVCTCVRVRVRPYPVNSEPVSRVLSPILKSYH